MKEAAVAYPKMILKNALIVFLLLNVQTFSQQFDHWDGAVGNSPKKNSRGKNLNINLKKQSKKVYKYGDDYG